MNTLSLGGVLLNSQMVWVDRDISQSVAQSVLTTLGGQPVVYSQSLIKGQSITLETGEGRGWLTKLQVDAVRQMAAQAGGIFELAINGTVMLVVFRHHEPPAFQATPLVPRFNQADQDKHTAVLKLMTV